MMLVVGGMLALLAVLAQAGAAPPRLAEIARIAVPNGPKSLRFAPGGRIVVANCLYGKRLAVIDAVAKKVTKTIRLPDEPVEIAFMNERYAWVSQYNTASVSLVDLAWGKAIRSIRVGSVPKVLEVSDDLRDLFVSNWTSGTVSIIDLSTKRLRATVKAGRIPRGIAFVGATAYVAIMGGSTLLKIDRASGRAVGSIKAGLTPRHVLRSPDGKWLYVSNNLPGTITIIYLPSGKAVGTIKVGKMPRSMALSPDGRTIYVCNYDSGTLGVVDVASRRQVATYKTNTHPIGVTVSPDGREVWVSSYCTSVVHVFAQQ